MFLFLLFLRLLQNLFIPWVLVLLTNVNAYVHVHHCYIIWFITSLLVNFFIFLNLTPWYIVIKLYFLLWNSAPLRNCIWRHRSSLTSHSFNYISIALAHFNFFLTPCLNRWYILWFESIIFRVHPLGLILVDRPHDFILFSGDSLNLATTIATATG